MTNSVRFYVSDAGPPSISGPGDFTERYGGSDSGTPGARWTFTADAFSWPASTDGTFLEFDFVVEDPADPSVMWWGFVGCSNDLSTPIATSTVTGGFTFDSDAPPAWAAYWGVSKKYKVDYDGTFPDVLVYDGSYTPFATTSIPFVVDGASASDWWLFATPPPPPPPDPPTITAPVDGSTVSYDTDITVVTLEWDPPVGGEPVTSYQVRLNTGAPIGASSPYDFTFTWPAAGTRTLSVRSVGDGGTSDWLSVTITLDPTVASPVDCFEAEALADTPDLLWLFREDDTQSWTADLSGNSHDGLIGSADVLQGADPHVPASITADAYYSVLYPTSLTPPAGVTLLGSEVDASGGHVAIYRHNAGTAHPSNASFVGASDVEVIYLPTWLRTVAAVGTATAHAAVGVTETISAPAVTWPHYGYQLVARTVGVTGDFVSARWGWRNDGTFPVSTGDPDYYQYTNQVSGSTFDIDFTGGIGGTDNALVAVLLQADDADYLGVAESSICDAGCADVNTSAHISSVAPFVPVVRSRGWEPTLDTYTVELVGRVHESLEVSLTPTVILQFGPDPLFGQDGIDCWQHLVFAVDPAGPSGYKTRQYLNGRLVSHSDSAPEWSGLFDLYGDGEASVAAVYPIALPPSRVAAHASHFCGLCRKGRGLVLGALTLS